MSSNTQRQYNPSYVRVRTKAEPYGHVSSTTLSIRQLSDGTILSGPNTYGPWTKASKTDMTDIVVPGYAQRVARGEVINNPMSRVSELYSSSQNSSGFELTNSALNQWYKSEGDVFGHCWYPTIPSLVYINEENLKKLAQTSALAGMNRPEIYSLVTLGELKKTLTMLVSPIRGLTKLLQNSTAAYKRDLRIYGNPLNRVMKIKNHRQRAKALERFKRYAKQRKESTPKSIPDRLMFIPDMVLCYNLGWKPLLMELNALLHTIPEKVYNERLTSRGKASDETEYSVYSGELVDGGRGLISYTDTFREVVSVRAGVLYEAEFGPKKDFGLRPQDVSASAWELIPFSFLVDYVYNIGDYIEAMSSLGRNRALAFFTTTRVTITATRNVTGVQGYGAWTAVKQPQGSLSCEKRVTTRDNTSFTPSIAHTPIYSSLNRPPAQLQNVLSLLTNLLSGTVNHKYR